MKTIKLIVFATYLLCIQFATNIFSQTVTIGTGTSTTTYNPLYTFYNYNYTQQIYLSSEITGVSSGDIITTVSFYWDGSGNLTNADSWVVYLGNTTKATFTGGTDWIPIASLTQVYNGTVSLPGAAGWMTITLSTPFVWSGNNLVVAIDENVAGYGSSAYWRYTSTSNKYRSIYYYSDGTNPDPAAPPSGTITYNRPNLQLIFTSPSPMSYTSSTTTQLNTTDVSPNTTAQEIIGIQIVTTGSTSPLSVTQFTVNANGSTNINDINAANSAKIYYTGTSSTFATTTLFGQNTPTIANFNITGSQALSTGTNYFWLVYDIKATATLGNVVDGQCASLTVGIARTPTVTAPAGNRTIALPYCIPAPSSVDGSGITNVTCGTINNTTGAEPGNYGNYSSQSATFMQSSLVTVNITFSTGYTYYTKIWVDWNNDGDFADAGEEVYSGESTSANPTTLVATFTVPAGAPVGNHRMRIGGCDSSTPIPCYTGSYGSYEDYTLNVTALPACSGTPTGGTTVADVNPVCPGTTVNLSVSGSTSASGLTYQWQSSPDNSAWSDIGGATSSVYSTALSNTTWFRRRTTCTISGLSATSSSLQVVVTLSISCYCTSTATSSSDMDITNITFVSINNTTPTVSLNGSQGTATGTAGMYSNWTASAVPVPTVMQSVVYPFSVTIGGTAYSHRVDVYIDFNRDGDLVDAGESFAIFPYADPSLPNTTGGNITIPAGATPGTTLMRVVCVESSSTNPCGTYTWGETEDYFINIVPAVACSGTPTAGSATATPNSICAPSSSTLSLSGYTVATGITFQWQSAPAAGGPWTNITGATNLSEVVSPTTTTYYRCVVTCTNSGLSANTAAISVSVSGPAYATVPYTCGFNSNWTSRCDTREIPDNYWVTYPFNGNASWRRSNAGSDAAWSTPADGLYAPESSEGTRSARFHSYYASGIGTMDLYIDLSTPGTKLLKFDYINTSGTDVMTVLLSTDGGVTFPTTLLTLTTAAAWTTYYAEISSTSATCAIRFSADGDAGSTDIGLDALSVNPPCSAAPTAGTASANIATYCNTGTPTLSLSGFTLAGGITIQWQSSITNSPYSWSDIGGQYSVSQYVPYTVNPAINQTIYFRAAVSCGANTSYSNIITVTNNASQITSTNSPVTVVCNTSANMTATASGGTISWYANATGGTALGTGGSFNQVVTANTTFYCAAGSGGSTYSIGKATSPLSDGYYGSTNTGLRFDALSAFTLVSVKVYVETASSNVRIQFQNNSGSPIGSDFVFNNCPAGLNTLTLNLSVPVGTGYRLVSNNTTNLARDFSGAAWPYTQAGICSITEGLLGGSSSTTYYFFYNWTISTGCESSPRTPVNVIVSGGVTAPVCSGSPDPAHLATNICPISTIISWSASNTPCRTATGYKLYFGTDAAATNIYNGLDIGLVTSYNLGNLLGNQIYYWRIVPYNTAGDGACATIWRFTTAANPGNICVTNMGTGVINVASLPYSSGNGTTKNKVNDLTSANTVTCGSSSYLGGEDQVFVFTPATSGSITINLTSSGTYTGLMLYDNCPLTGTVCGATQGSCIAYSQDYDGTRTLTTCVTAGITYYLILDSYPLPDWNAYSNLTISAPSGSVASNDLPCNALPLTLGAPTAGDNACTGGSMEPSTPSCWTYGILNTIWYSVVCPASGQLTIQTSLGTLTNTQIAVYSGSCSALSYVSGACNDNTSGCGSGSNASILLLSGLTPGATYYIRVDGAYDLIGGFSILAIDGTQALPTTLGQDCSAALPTCATSISVADPGYSGTGSICDFDGSYDCTGGDKAAVFYTIEIASPGQLMFDIVPNDYSGGSPGDGTDYDFIIWKIAGSGTLATCASIMTNSSTGMMACNYSYIDVTGLYTGGNAPSAYGSGFDAAYEPPITVAAGDVYLLWISNFSLSTSGFTINYNNSSPSSAIINISATPTLVAWSGATSTSWTTASNWGGCGAPNTCATSVVIPNYAPTMPVITSNVSVNDLTINAGASLTINTGNTLTICGNFTNNGTITVNGTGRIIFAGASPQLCTNNSGTLTIPRVEINNTGGGVTLAGGSGNMIIPTNLALTSGILFTSSSAMVIMNAGSSVTPAGGIATSFVDGPIQKIGNTAFVFPTGDANRWARLAISAPTAASTFQAQYFTTPFSTLTPMAAQGAATLDHVSGIEYWQLDRIAGGGNASVTLYWQDANWSQIWVCASYLDLSVAKWDGSFWNNLNTTGGAITCGAIGNITTQAAVTSFSPFTFGTLRPSITNPLPIELLHFAGRTEGDINLIEWKTASETNNDYFIL